MALDLSALEEKPVLPSAGEAAQLTGKPLDIPLIDIAEDPNQPRKEFTAEAMKEMTDSIRARGVKTPVSVCTHPTSPGKWMLNYGARRYRGAIAAGCQTIPAFVDESHGDYDQVIENIQRDDLKPMELALFIKKRLDAGDKKKVIAENLSKGGAIITHHLALIDLPACIEDVYSTGRCTSPQTLYELRGLHETFPEQVEAWCADSVEITRKMVSKLADELKGKRRRAPEVGEGQQGGDELSGDKIATTSELSENEGDGSDKTDTVDTGERDTGEFTSWPKGRAVSDPGRMSKPLMLVEFDERLAAVLLNRRPSIPGLIHIRFEDGGGDHEVDASSCKINLLTEAEK